MKDMFLLILYICGVEEFAMVWGLVFAGRAGIAT